MCVKNRIGYVGEYTCHIKRKRDLTVSIINGMLHYHASHSPNVRHSHTHISHIVNHSPTLWYPLPDGKAAKSRHKVYAFQSLDLSFYVLVDMRIVMKQC